MIGFHPISSPSVPRRLDTNPTEPPSPPPSLLHPATTAPARSSGIKQLPIPRRRSPHIRHRILPDAADRLLLLSREGDRGVVVDWWRTGSGMGGGPRRVGRLRSLLGRLRGRVVRRVGAAIRGVEGRRGRGSAGTAAESGKVGGVGDALLLRVLGVRMSGSGWPSPNGRRLLRGLVLLLRGGVRCVQLGRCED